MPRQKPDVILIGPLKPLIVKGLEAACTLHKAAEAKDLDAFYAEHADVGAIAICATTELISDKFMARFPRLQIISSFGVGYDHIDAKSAGARGIIVTNTPEVLTEEVADTALGLLLCTVRELPQSDRFVRAGKWAQQGFPLTRATLRNRTVGMVGMGAIGKAIARRLDAFGVPVVYHARNKRPEVPYRHYPNLLDMARDVDTLMVIVPGGAATANLINAHVLDALGPNGILINMARGSVVDEPAQGAAAEAHNGRGPRRLCQGTACAGRVDGHGERRAVSPCRLGFGLYARQDGSACRRQHRGLGRRQAAADAGCRNALDILAESVKGAPGSHTPVVPGIDMTARRCRASVGVHW